MADDGPPLGVETAERPDWVIEEELARRHERRLLVANMGLSFGFHIILIVALMMLIGQPPGRTDGLTEIKLDAKVARLGDEDAPDKKGLPSQRDNTPKANPKEITQRNLDLNKRLEAIDRSQAEQERRQQQELTERQRQDAAAARAAENQRVKGIRSADARVDGNLRGRAGIGKLEPRTFYGMKVHSRKMVFVLDISGSMNIPFAKMNLRNAYATLGAKERFAIVCYDNRIFYWPRSKQLLPATRRNKARADAWLRELSGGGQTNIYDALKKAFEISSNGTAADTFYFLSDGRPTASVRNVDLILKAVRQWNRRERVKVHTIGIGDHDRYLMENVAKENRGIYRALSN